MDNYKILSYHAESVLNELYWQNQMISCKKYVNWQ